MSAQPPRVKRLEDLPYEARKKLAIYLRELVDAAKAERCKDCGNWYARTFGGQMTFDHLDPRRKLFNIGTVGVNDQNELGHRLVTPQMLREEIAKCDVVCRACHNKRERKRDEERRAREARQREYDEKQRKAEELRVWRDFSRAATAGHYIWVDTFGRLGRIFALAHSRSRSLTVEQDRQRSLEWSSLWVSAVGNVIRDCCRGFMSPVFKRQTPSGGVWVDRTAWKKLVNFAPRPWKADRGGGS